MGAEGQASLYTLARLLVTGTLVAVDPELLALSNLQRYVMVFDDDVGRSSTFVRLLTPLPQYN